MKDESLFVYLLFVSVLALSVSHSFDSSPKGGALGKTENFAVLPRPLTLGELSNECETERARTLTKSMEQEV